MPGNLVPGIVFAFCVRYGRGTRIIIQVSLSLGSKLPVKLPVDV
jgi:hypothetical protein